MTETVSRAKIMEAIRGSGGNISLIAERAGCSRDTLYRRIKKYEGIRQAFQDECDRVLDVAESVITRNIELAREKQDKGEIADTSDAKWWLSKKRLGYTDKVEISGGIELLVPEDKVEEWVGILTRSIGRTYSEDKSGK